jgi:predicted alpha/beta superfamily hydrolase
MRLLTALLLIALLAAPAHAQRRYERATHIGRVDSIRSRVLDEHRPFLIYTPPSYADTTLVPTRYPVLYLLDGDAHFHSVSALVQILGTGVNGTFVAPEMIVVAIPNVGENRTRDLTPTKATRGPDGSDAPSLAWSGGGPAFLDFLRTELIPHIDASYRGSPGRDPRRRRRCSATCRRARA